MPGFSSPSLMSWLSWSCSLRHCLGSLRKVIIKKKVEENSNSKAGLLSVFYLVGFAWKRRRGFRECAGQLLQQRHSSWLGWENIRTFYLGANWSWNHIYMIRWPTLMLGFIFVERRRCWPGGQAGGLELILPIIVLSWCHTVRHTLKQLSCDFLVINNENGADRFHCSHNPHAMKQMKIKL